MTANESEQTKCIYCGKRFNLHGAHSPYGDTRCPKCGTWHNSNGNPINPPVHSPFGK